MTSQSKTLFLIGGTGGLGFELAKGLVTAEGYASRKALVRDAALVRDNADTKAAGLKAMGWELVTFSDYANAEALQTALKGAHTIVSALSGGEMVTLETAIVDAAKANGASLFVPSQFGVDYLQTSWVSCTSSHHKDVHETFACDLNPDIH